MSSRSATVRRILARIKGWIRSAAPVAKSTTDPPPAPDLRKLCGAADRVLELVVGRVPGTAPAIRDWNDRLFVEAFARAYRCLRSVRLLAERRAADDAAVLTRALVSLTLQYLWLIRPEDDAERRDRLRRLERKWASERATLGEELTDLGYFSRDAEELQAQIAEFRASADTLKGEGVPGMLGERYRGRPLRNRCGTSRIR
jgi:hypothetical protein